MTEEIPSDRHKRKHSSSAEIDTAERLAILKERLRHSDERDRTIVAQLDILIGKMSKVELGMMLGERRFDEIEERHEETTQTLQAVAGRVSVVESAQSSVAHKIMGGGMVVTFLVSVIALFKEWLPFLSGKHTP